MRAPHRPDSRTRDRDAVPARPEHVRAAPTPAGSAHIAPLALAVAVVAAVLWPVLGSRAVAP
jgi:hypothetical protein